MRSSRQQILLSTATFGGSSLANVLVSIVRAKVVAVLLGASGTAVIGLLGTTLQTGTAVAGMGLRTSGVRELAVSGDDVDALSRVRRALGLAHLGLGLVAAIIFAAFSGGISILLFGTPDRRLEVACVGVGIFLSLVASAQSALLQGLRRISDLAVASSIATVAGATFALLAIGVGGTGAIWFYMLCTPAVSVLASRYFVARLPTTEALPRAGSLVSAWRSLFLLGAAFMVTSSLPGLSKLLVQARIGHAIGLEPSGHYQAAWSISMQYLGFALTAMATDYYPRLAQGLRDRDETNALVNDQAYIGLLLAGPIVIAIAALSPLVLSLLYAPGFAEAAGLLRWQALGDVLKVAGWPIGFVLLAGAETRLFLLTQTTWALAYVGLSFALIPRLGLEATGIAFASACAAGFVLNCIIVGSRFGLRISRTNWLVLAWMLAACAAVLVLSRIDALLAASTGLALAAVTALVSGRKIIRVAFPGGFRSGVSTIFKRSARRGE
jgi:PST family polysaccharide transporter